MNRATRLLSTVFLGIVPAIGATSERSLAEDPKGEVVIPDPSKKKPATEKAVYAGLAWLKAHQSADGHWSRDKFDETCKLNRCPGAGAPGGDVGVTGIVLLAFLGAGETHQSGNCRETVKKGLEWLSDAQWGEGCIGPRTAPDFLRQHAIGALALTEAYGMTGSKAFKAPAQRVVAFALGKRRTAGGWSKTGDADGELDVETTTFMAMLLKSAQMSALQVDAKALTDAAAALDGVTDAKTGETKGGAAATGMALVARIFAGRTPKDDPLIDKAGDFLAAHLPRKDAEDQLAWYFGSLAMFQLGGDRWKAWNEAMKAAILDRQYAVHDRDEIGSWEPGKADAEGGRVWVTALQTLDLEVYYRYGRVMGK